MRRAALILLVVLVAFAIWLWGMGGADQVSRWAAATQREVQNAMAGALRALQAGQPGAVFTLWGLCFTYGFVHAAGPGHGKLLIGGYGLGARVPAARLAGLAVVSSLAQAVTAVLLVYASVWVLGWGRAQMTGVADQVMAPLSYALIAGVGVWLMLRGLRKVRRYWAAPQAAAHHTHAHDHAHAHAHDHHAPAHDHHDHARDHHHHHTDGICDTCGHAHGPTPDQAASVRSLRDAVVLIGSIAVRPCTGALFLLILTWRLGIDWAGIIGALVMGLGTASVTVVVALAAVGMRESALAQAASSRSTARLLAGVEVLAGLLVAILALQLLARTV